MKSIPSALLGGAKIVSHSSGGKILTGSAGYIAKTHVRRKHIKAAIIAVGTGVGALAGLAGKRIYTSRTK